MSGTGAGRLALLVAVTALLAACSALASPGSRSAGGAPTGEPLSRVPSSPGGNLTTYHYDNARSGDGPAAPSLARLRRVWSDHGIDGAVYAEPLVAGNLVLVVTETDEVYALSASSGRVLWRRQLGVPAEAGSVQSAPGLGGCGDVFPLGITSTPVIDASRGEAFVAAEVQRRGHPGWQGIAHILAAVKISNGRVVWSRRIDPPGAGRTYTTAALQQRSALSLVKGRVVVELGGLLGDCGNYHGYVVSVAESGAGPELSYRVPTEREGAIWAVSGAAATAAGELFVATGNGSSTSTFDMGDAVIGLSGRLREEGFFAPRDWAALNANDLDLGAGGPILLTLPAPGRSGTEELLFESGKHDEDDVNVGYLLDPSHLGGIGHPLYSGTACPSDQVVFGAFATARESFRGRSQSFVYVPCSGGTAALVVSGVKHPSFRRVWQASANDPNGPPLVAGGLVWALSTPSNGGTQSNMLSGMNPTTGRVVVTEQLGDIGVTTFSTPAAAGGRLFVGGGDGVVAFGR